MISQEAFIVILGILLIAGIAAITLYWTLPLIEEQDLCKELFHPENSTEQFLGYQHCLKYPDTYGVNR
jgi:hypothetical protein